VISLHILFLSHYFFPEVNAPATRTYEHCKRWVSDGHQVTVVTGAPNCPDGVVYKGHRNRLYQKQIIDGIRVIRLWTFIAPNKGSSKRIANYLSYLFLPLIYSVFFIRKVDVMVATSPQFFCGWAGVICRLLRKWPFVLEVRDIWPDSIVTVGAMRKSLAISCLEQLERIMYKSANHIVTLGNGYAQNIVSKGISSDQISIIPNGADSSITVDYNEGEIWRRKLKLEGKKVCAYIGTIGMAHGLNVALEAAQMAKDSFLHELFFLIVGDGAQRKYLEDQARERCLDNVCFLGRLSKKDLCGIYAVIDVVLIHLKKKELFTTVLPSKMFEAMALNIPIIMGVGGEALEIVRKANAGIMMDPEDPVSLLDALKTLLDENKHVYKAREFVMEHFNRDVLARRMLDILIKQKEGKTRGICT
jgi:glycosyltransferase involved in cell wall biosynthesis